MLQFMAGWRMGDGTRREWFAKEGCSSWGGQRGPRMVGLWSAVGQAGMHASGEQRGWWGGCKGGAAGPACHARSKPFKAMTDWLICCNGLTGCISIRGIETTQQAPHTRRL